MKLEERVRELILSNPSNLKSGLERIAKKLGIKDPSGKQLIRIKVAKKAARQELKGVDIIPIDVPTLSREDSDIEAKFAEIAERLGYELPKKKPTVKVRKEKKYNVLVIGDLHLPFERPGYLEFCIDTYKKHKCNRVVFIGDIIDSHYSSFHATDPDGLGGGAELELCIERVKDWYEAFPQAEICIGNHDAIIMRKAFDSGVPKIWIKDFNDVLGTPNWKWVTDTYINGIRYVHGHKSSKARTATRRDMVSTVTGHYHTDFYIDYMFGKTRSLFAMAVGCGIDDSQYAFAYAAGGKKNAIGCGVVLEGGTTPILVAMDLERYKN